MKNFPDLPPVWALGFAVLAFFLAKFVPVYDARGWISGWVPWSMIGLGLALVFWAAFWFWRKKTTIEPHHKPTSLIIEGPYRLSRNPIYTGMALIIFGFCLWLGAVSSLLALAGFVWVVTRRFILAEEAGLRDAFGVEADNYLQKTRRW